jgi:hypothetical protein
MVKANVALLFEARDEAVHATRLLKVGLVELGGAEDAHALVA